MNTTKLSSKGQVIIPKAIRMAHHWETGQDFTVINTRDGVLLKSKTPFQESSLDEVASCLKYQGKKKTLDDMEQAIKQGAMEYLGIWKYTSSILAGLFVRHQHGSNSYVASYAPISTALMTNKKPAQILDAYLFPGALSDCS